MIETNAIQFCSTSFPGSRVGIVSPFPITAKKRKIDDEPSTSKAFDSFGFSTKSTASKLSDDGVFKKPAIPRKMRRVQRTDPPKIDPAITANIDVINKLALKVNLSPDSNQRSPPIKRSASAATATSESPPKKMQTRSKAKAEPLTEMGALFNMVIERNTQKVSDSIRTSLTDMLNEIWDASKPTQQLKQMQNQIDSMRINHGGQVDALENENNALKQVNCD